jgi:hypothetical protein
VDGLHPDAASPPMPHLPPSIETLTRKKVPLHEESDQVGGR